MAKPVTRLYEEHADWFALARLQGTFPERKYVDQFVEDLPRGAEVIDVGCGTGRPIAEYLFGKGFRVTGVDVSERLLAHARQAFPRARWIRADMRELRLGRRFDAVLAWDSFFHLTKDEQRAMFSVFRDHLKPDGRLMFTSGPEDAEAIGEMCGDPLYHASLAPKEYRALLERAGFRVIAFQLSDPDCGGHTVWITDAV